MAGSTKVRTQLSHYFSELTAAQDSLPEKCKKEYDEFIESLRWLKARTDSLYDVNSDGEYFDVHIYGRDRFVERGDVAGLIDAYDDSMRKCADFIKAAGRSLPKGANGEKSPAIEIGEILSSDYTVIKKITKGRRPFPELFAEASGDVITDRDPVESFISSFTEVGAVMQAELASCLMDGDNARGLTQNGSPEFERMHKSLEAFGKLATEGKLDAGNPSDTLKFRAALDSLLETSEAYLKYKGTPWGKTANTRVAAAKKIKSFAEKAIEGFKNASELRDEKEMHAANAALLKRYNKEEAAKAETTEDNNGFTPAMKRKLNQLTEFKNSLKRETTARQIADSAAEAYEFMCNYALWDRAIEDQNDFSLQLDSLVKYDVMMRTFGVGKTPDEISDSVPEELWHITFQLDPTFELEMKRLYDQKDALKDFLEKNGERHLSNMVTTSPEARNGIFYDGWKTAKENTERRLNEVLPSAPKNNGPAM